VAEFEKPSVVWRRSTKTGGQNCVEVAVVGGSVLIRDSMNPDGGILRLPPTAWSAFLARARGTDPGPGRP
jgi:Domain of unknown function (DUF397)